MNKKAQLDYPIITFAIIVVALILFAPIALKLFINIKSGVSAGLGNVSGQAGVVAQTNFDAAIDPSITFWDKVIIAVFFFSILLLFVSAFMIDAHPFFIVLYIVLSFMLVIFAPNIIQAADNIYTSSQFAGEVSRLSFMDSLRSNFVIFLIGIIVITGIIIYGKVAFGGNRRGK